MLRIGLHMLVLAGMAMACLGCALVLPASAIESMPERASEAVVMWVVAANLIVTGVSLVIGAWFLLRSIDPKGNT